MAAGLYDITNKTLGRGHFGVVKLAKQCLTGESVAVKIVDKLKLENDGLQQLGLEIKLLSRLSEKGHPNIIKLYQVIDTNSKLYLVMEYTGKNACDLYSYIRKNNNGQGLNESDARHIFKQVCSAIFYCHSIRIAHRDLKPENILIVTESSELPTQLISYPLVKLIDFGFSNQWNEGEKLRTSCGSLAYSPPEILLGDHYDADKVDIWSLGCILYILLYGNNPFMEMNDSETLIRILDCRFKTPWRPSVGKSSINLIQSMLKRDPKNRLTIQEVLDHPWFKVKEGDDREDQSAKEDQDISKAKDVSKENKSPINISKQDSCFKPNNEDSVNAENISKKFNNDVENIVRRTVNRAQSFDLNEMREEEENNQGEVIIGSINGENKGKKFNLSSDTFFTANNDVIRDKFSSEFYANVNNIKVNSASYSHTKKMFPSRPRKQLISSSRMKSSLGSPLREIKEEKINYLNKSASLDITFNSEDDGCFVLPLARKCSVVSEEGSCTGTDISGNEGGSERLIESSLDEPVEVSKSSVGIVVTDYSNTELCKSNQSEDETFLEDTFQFVSLSPIFKKSSANTSANNSLSGGGGGGGENSSCGKLHLVSSSPELLREESFYESPSNSREMSSSTSLFRPKMILNHQQDSHNDYMNEQIITHFANKKSNQAQSSKATSMRVIIHSKSYNNILLPNEDIEEKRRKKEQESGGRGKIHLGKRSKSSKPECCLVC